MKILVIGSGGREHALAWRLRQCPSVESVYAAPGNPGISATAECHSGSDYVKIAHTLGVDLAVVGPEVPLVAGIVDQFRALNMPIVGPTAANAMLEGSKIHSKLLMRKLGIPTAPFQVIESAQQLPGNLRYPIVLKTDGLAAGKGVVIAHDRVEVDSALQTLPFPILIEEFLEGEEVSFIVLCDGKKAVPLEPSQDHKRVFDGDSGPNTGGMGAYSDSRILPGTVRDQILDTVIQPVLRATAYTGFLYAGLMLTNNGPSVLEFNVRLGDPETQPLMMRLESDLGEVLMQAARGSLRQDTLDWSPNPATCVVMASGGYPGSFASGALISGIESVEGAVVFQAGTKYDAGRLVTAGGRVLGVTATGTDLRESIAASYAAVDKIHFEGMHFRKDIGSKGLERYNTLDRARSSAG